MGNRYGAETNSTTTTYRRRTEGIETTS